MNTTTTLVFYLLLGGAVAVALHLAEEVLTARERWFRTLTALIFWPLYVSSLLQRPASTKPTRLGYHHSDLSNRDLNVPNDELSRAIRQVEAELDLALNTLDGWSDSVFAREQHRFEQLRGAWQVQAQRIRDLDQLLSQSTLAERVVVGKRELSGNRIAKCEQARLENIASLGTVRARLHTDLVNTLAWVRELVTKIYLAKYTGAPASCAEELVMQIAAAVEGLSEVASWHDHETVGSKD